MKVTRKLIHTLMLGAHFGLLESSSTKIVQCPGPVKFSSFQPPERVFCVFRETGFQFSSCDRFSFLRKSSAVTYWFVHLGSLFCSIFVFLCLVVSIFLRLNVSFVGFCVAILSNSPALLYSRALLVFRALLRALGF